MGYDIENMKAFAKQLRHDIVDMINFDKGRVGHLGGSCSMADIVAALYCYKMNYDPKDYKKADRDRLVFSKGHAVIVQYAALCELGVLEKEEINTLKMLGSRLQGHPESQKTPGVEANTGSLGQGLSIGLGMALGFKLDGLDSKAYVVMGDGELAEGQIWEAAMAAARFKCNNLIGIVDANGVQANGRLVDRFDQGDQVAKFKAFGWNVIELDGHNMEEICKALDAADECKDKPTVLYAHTVKGKGVSFAEGNHKFHNGALTEEQFYQAHKDIDAM